MFERIVTFGTETTLVESRNFSKLASSISQMNRQSVFFCNVHMLMLSQEDTNLAEAMSSAEIVFADGVPIAWLQRKLSGKAAQVVRGYEVMLAICKRAAKQGESVGFIGSTEPTLDRLIKNLSDEFTGLKVAYRMCPPFMKGEITTNPTEIQFLKESGVQWLFVGLGCPKQEKWIARYKHELDCHILGVGAAFDWLSGAVKKPPHWMEKYALAWLYRFFQHPGRMWHRYLIYNTKFIIKAFPLLVRRK